MHTSNVAGIYFILGLLIKIQRLVIATCNGLETFGRNSRYEFDIAEALEVASVPQKLRCVVEEIPQVLI